MRNRLLTTIAAFGALSAPAFAADLTSPYIPPSGDPIYSPQPMVVGHLELGIGVLSFDEDFFEFEDTIGVFVGAGRANIPFSGGSWNLEFEVGGAALFDEGSSVSTIGTAAHVWTRLNSAAVGAYGGVNFPTGFTVYTVGLEGEVYLGNFTLGANADYNWVDGSADAEFWRVRGEADVYLTPEWRFGGELSYLDFNSGGPAIWSAALDTEYRFSGTPFSLWAEGIYSNIDGGGGDADVWAGLIGFRIFMDGAGTTLQQHDQQVPWDSGLLGHGVGLAF